MAIVVDASTPNRASATAALTIATASFTAPSSAVLVACVSANSTPAGNPTLTVSDSGGLAWTARITRLQSQGGGSTGGTCAIWTAVTSSSAARTVTATASGTGTANGISVKCYVVTGADTTTPNGTTTSGASQVNVTTTTAYVSTINNSRGFVAATEWNELGVPTSTDTGDGADVTGDIAVLSAFKAADTATSGTSVSFNLDAAGTGTPDWTYAALEIRPAAGAAAAVPYASRPQLMYRDPGESYFTQPPRRALPGLLGTALLENELLGGGSTVQHAAVQPRVWWLRQDRPMADQSPAAAPFDPTQVGSVTARAMPATHDDRRLVPQQSARFAAVDTVTAVGTGATGAWWSDDPAVAYIAATQPRRSDPSLLSTPGIQADPLQFPPQTAVRTAVTHADRRDVPPQRGYPAPPDTVTSVGTGSIGAWWSVDDAAHFGPAQRRTVVDQSSQPASTPYDPTTAPASTARMAAATHAPRPRPAAPRPPVAAIDAAVTAIGTGATGAWWSVDDWAHFGPAQRRQGGVPDDTLVVGTGAMVAWWGIDDAASYIGQRRPLDVGILGQAPVPFDPTLGGWPMDWLAWSRAATHADRRLVPQQRPYISDPGFYPLPPNPADPLLLAGAVGGDTWRRVNLPAFADRREVPQQPQRETLYFDAGPGVPPLTLSWGAGGRYWHLYNPPSRPRLFWPQPRLSAPLGACDCHTHRPFTGVTARPSSTLTGRPSSGVTTRPCTCS